MYLYSLLLNQYVYFNAYSIVLPAFSEISVTTVIYHIKFVYCLTHDGVISK